MVIIFYKHSLDKKAQKDLQLLWNYSEKSEFWVLILNIYAVSIRSVKLDHLEPWNKGQFC